MKKIHLFLLFLIGIQLYSVIMFGKNCVALKDQFFFNRAHLAEQTEILTHNDIGIPLMLIRALHNKVVVGLSSVYDITLIYLDPFFIVAGIGFVGLVFFVIGAYYVLKSKKKIYLLLFFPLILSILFSMFFSSPSMRFLNFLLPFSFLLISSFGLVQFISHHHDKKTLILITVLLLLSLFWLLALPSDLYRFCIQK